MRNSPMVSRIALALVIGLGACAGGLSESGGGSVEYSVSAKQNYERGMEKLRDEAWIEAAKYFAFVKSRFPYSKYAVLAELRLADAESGAGAHLEAADSYRLFIKFHPTHDMVVNGYAQFKIGAAYFRMLPDDWFLVPPAHEKDQSATYDALRELDTFLKNYPNSEFVPQAKEMYVKCAKKLADHEWYVARFYWKKNRPMGTVIRLRTLLSRYPG